MNRCYAILSLIADQMIAFFLIGPLVVAYWRSAYNILGIYLLPDFPRTSTWICFGVGNIGLAVLPLFKWLFRQIVTKDLPCCSVRRWLGFNTYLYVAGFISQTRFRGGWDLLKRHTGTGLLTEGVILAISMVLLCLARSFKNCSAAPFRCDIDTDPDVMEDRTRFNIPISSPIRYVLDNLLTTLVLRNLVLAFWKGLWGLLDLTLFPDDPLTSYAISLFIAVAVMAILTPVQIVMLQFQTLFRKKLVVQIVLDLVVFLPAGFCSVLYWRAIWGMFNLYFVPHNAVISNWTSYGIAVVFLGLLKSSASYLLSNFEVDGDTFEEEHTTAVFANKYIRYLLDSHSVGGEQKTEKNEKDSSSNASEQINLLARR